MSAPPSRGRPRSVSRGMLQEAAFDLFLASGYEGTTVDQIANCAGVSRGTFFNYFDAKSDVFWVELDDSLDVLREALSRADAHTPVMLVVRRALLAVGAELGPHRVPWALTHGHFIGGVAELQSSAVVRVTRLVDVLSSAIVARLPAGGEPLGRAAAAAAIGAAVAALVTWAEAGTGRGELEPYLDSALDPVCDGFQRAIDAMPA